MRLPPDAAASLRLSAVCPSSAASQGSAWGQNRKQCWHPSCRHPLGAAPAGPRRPLLGQEAQPAFVETLQEGMRILGAGSAGLRTVLWERRTLYHGGTVSRRHGIGKPCFMCLYCFSLTFKMFATSCLLCPESPPLGWMERGGAWLSNGSVAARPRRPRERSSLGSEQQPTNQQNVREGDCRRAPSYLEIAASSGQKKRVFPKASRSSITTCL